MSPSLPTETDVQARLKTFVKRFARHSEIADDEDIFATRAVTSMFAMQLVLFLEKNFAIAIENEDLSLENFSTIRRIGQLVQRKLANQAVAAE